MYLLEYPHLTRSNLSQATVKLPLYWKKNYGWHVCQPGLRCPKGHTYFSTVDHIKFRMSLNIWHVAQMNFTLIPSLLVSIPSSLIVLLTFRSVSFSSSLGKVCPYSGVPSPIKGLGFLTRQSSFVTASGILFMQRDTQNTWKDRASNIFTVVVKLTKQVQYVMPTG